MQKTLKLWVNKNPPSQKKITVQLDTGPEEILAEVFGNWAAHQSVGGHGWSVTCVPYGRIAAGQLHKRQAFLIASLLRERVPDFRWSGKDGELPHEGDMAIARAVLFDVRGW